MTTKDSGYTDPKVVKLRKPVMWANEMGDIKDEDGNLLVQWNGLDSAAGEKYREMADRIVEQHNWMVAKLHALREFQGIVQQIRNEAWQQPGGTWEIDDSTVDLVKLLCPRVRR